MDSLFFIASPGGYLFSVIFGRTLYRRACRELDTEEDKMCGRLHRLVRAYSESLGEGQGVFGLRWREAERSSSREAPFGGEGRLFSWQICMT
jgi:hypothetical protein